MGGTEQSTSTMAAPEHSGKALYNRSFFDPELAASRRLLIKTFVLPILYTSLLLWACLSLYWGSTTSSSLHKLTVYAINLDDGAFGQEMIAGVNTSIRQNYNSLGWRIDDAVTEDIISRHLVTNEQAWAVVQVNTNTSSILDTALRTGDQSYNSQSAVTIYYASARNQITTLSKVVPAILAVLEPLLARLNAEHTTQFLSTHVSNTTALTTALQCRACLTSPFASTQLDLAPFNAPTATGSTMVGLIFLLTFTFSVFQILHLNGELIGAQLNVRSAILFRIVMALVAYLLISLWYTLINLAFGVPMNRVYRHGQGFLVYWMLNFCTMAALGLPLESLFTIIGLKWAGYFLSFWIILNVSSSFSSFDTMPGFYSYGYGFPFANSIQGARTIIFGTKNHLGRNFGVLIAWMVVGAMGVAMFTAMVLKKNRRTVGRGHVLK